MLLILCTLASARSFCQNGKRRMLLQSLSNRINDTPITTMIASVRALLSLMALFLKARREKASLLAHKHQQNQKRKHL